MRTPLFTLSLLILCALILGSPGLLWAQTTTASRSRDVQMVQRLTELERQNAALRTKVVRIETQMDDMERQQRRFRPARAAATFLISSLVVTTSYWAADRVFGDGMRKYAPEFSPGRTVGYGALAAVLPSLLAGIGSGVRSTALTSTGITVDVLLATTPWVAGAAINAIAANMPTTPEIPSEMPSEVPAEQQPDEGGEAWF